KNGAFNLPGGGAKGGVDIDPHDPEARGMLSRYVRAMTPLYRSGWGTAEDLGVTQELLNEVFAEQGVGMTVQAMLDRSGDAAAAGRRVVQGLAIKGDGIALAAVIGGYGVAEAAAAGARRTGGGGKGVRGGGEGVGSQGGSSARGGGRHRAGGAAWSKDSPSRSKASGWPTSSAAMASRKLLRRAPSTRAGT